MITGKVNEAGISIEMYRRVRDALDYLKQVDVSLLPLGKTTPASAFYVQHLSYQTTSWDGVLAEGHQRTLEMHYMVSGAERILVADSQLLEPVGKYQTERDLIYYSEPTEYREVVLRAGEFLALGPEEAHKTNGLVEGQVGEVVKVVVKVLIP